MARKVRRFPTIFEKNRSVDFERFDPEFKSGLRALVLHVQRTGGMPTATSRVDGVEVGDWLNGVQYNPHVLTQTQRAVLLAVPNMRLCEPGMRTATLNAGETDPDRAYLWRRLQAWAKHPGLDPVIARRMAHATLSKESDV